MLHAFAAECCDLSVSGWNATPITFDLAEEQAVATRFLGQSFLRMKRSFYGPSFKNHGEYAMESLAAWLRRLGRVEPNEIGRTIVRIFLPGHTFMNYDHWLMTTEQPTSVPSGFRGSYPESISLLAYPDDACYSRNAPHHHRLTTDIAAVMSIALERRVEIPYEVAAGINGQGTVTFLQIGGTTDRTVTGPLPWDSLSPVAEVFRQVSGLGENDLAAIGAATSMFHGALLLHDKDVRSAYTLLVAGIEALSRQYGQPPTSWSAWESHDEWDKFVVENDLSAVQAKKLRERLMANRQLRIKATFKSYASLRLRAAFWDQPWVEWIYPMHLPQGNWDAPRTLHEGWVRDFLPADRMALGRALGFSYDLRSRYVHEGTWFGPLELTLNPGVPVDASRPLPFAVLRAILRELILVELTDRTRDGSLPDVQLVREWVPSPS